MSALNKIRHAVQDLFRYPTFQRSDPSYNNYWSQRDMLAPLNEFQADRVNIIVGMLHDGDSVLDIGCGDGRILAELKRRKNINVLGMDTSEDALRVARERGISVQCVDILSLHKEHPVTRFDWVLLLEVLEHISQSEVLLEEGLARARKAVLFSVPNTGYVVHRLRLLLGRFPLQWRAHPGEHVRFWTHRDMRYWLSSLECAYEMHPYQGVPFLRRIWPSLFAAGLFVVVKPRS